MGSLARASASSRRKTTEMGYDSATPHSTGGGKSDTQAGFDEFDPATEDSDRQSSPESDASETDDSTEHVDDTGLVGSHRSPVLETSSPEMR